jgi:putative two-component system response regulator
MDMKLKAIILIVDSSSDNLVFMEGLLQERHHIKLARTGADAIRIVKASPRPDLILIDTSLPDMDGFTLHQELRTNFLSADIPVLYLTQASQPEEERRALREGGRDVVAKPFTPDIFLARVEIQLQLAFSRALLRDQHGHFDYLLSERTRQASQMQDATIVAMASLAEARDPDIANHIRRTQHYVLALARELRFHSDFVAELTDENINLLFRAVPLHDIGKVAVPDAILFKPGPLTEAEFAIMKQHTIYGRDAIAGVERTLGASNAFLRYAREITCSHQEYWDGSGYPEGLQGRAIPLSARLMAVADVYDALISSRLYRPAFTHETAVELIRQGRGEHFDPDVVDAMLVVEDKFRAIAAEFRPLA